MLGVGGRAQGVNPLDDNVFRAEGAEAAAARAGWWAAAVRTFWRIQSHRTGLVAAGCAFYATLALFPAQVSTGLAGRKLATGAGRLPFKALFWISLAGGALGGLLLLNTPSSVFARLVPWLVLFATTVFAWGNFLRKPKRLPRASTMTHGWAPCWSPAPGAPHARCWIRRYRWTC